jgi:hypothetical protein
MTTPGYKPRHVHPEPVDMSKYDETGLFKWLVPLGERARHMLDDMVWTAMEANGEDPNDMRLFALRKQQAAWGAEKPCDRVDPHAVQAYAERLATNTA